jgi:FkbM family methyltransferase
MGFLVQIFDFLASQYLAYRGSRHRKSGCPPIAVFAFDLIGHEINLQGRYEAANLYFTFRFLQESGLISGVAVDVGANIGNHSLYFAEHFDHVVALEPNPKVFELLCINSRLRDNIRPLNIGASDVSGEMLLSYNSRNWGGASLMGGAQGPADAVTVPVLVKKLDELEDLASRRVGLIKIDVEGHELRVLKGALKVLARSHPVVLFEQHAGEISNGSSEVVGWLRSNGYDRFLEVRSFPSLPRAWTGPGRMVVNGLLRVVAGERKKVVPIVRFERAFYPMIIALPSR